MWVYLTIEGVEMSQQEMFPISASGILGLLLGGAIGLVLIVFDTQFGIFPEPPELTPATSVDVARYLDLSEGIEYSVSSVNRGEAPTVSYSDFFGTTDSLMIKVILDGDDEATITVPFSSVKFVTVDTAETFVEFDLTMVNTPGLGNVEGDDFIPAPQLEKITLQSFINSYLQSVTLTLSQQEYEKLHPS